MYSLFNSKNVTFAFFINRLLQIMTAPFSRLLYIVFYCFTTLGFALCTLTYAQETFPVNGVRDNRHLYYAFINANLVVDYKTTIDNGILLIRDGMIIGAGKDVTIPKGAVISDLKGKFIYPSFIDIYTNYGMPALKKPKGTAHRKWRAIKKALTHGIKR